MSVDGNEAICFQLRSVGCSLGTTTTALINLVDRLDNVSVTLHCDWIKRVLGTSCVDLIPHVVNHNFAG